MIYPMFTMVLLTLLVGIVALKARFASVKSGQMNLGYFKLMKGEQVSDGVTVSTRCFNNQFEIPVLFYVACTLHLSLGLETLVGLLLAWGFVVCRVIQAAIHLSYNHIFHRMLAFLLAIIMVLALWVNLIVDQL